MIPNLAEKSKAAQAAMVFFGLLAALCVIAGSVFLTVHLPNIFRDKNETTFDCDDVNGLYSASYNWGKAHSLTERIQAGCLFCCIIYPLVFLGFCCSWRLPNFMVLFAENYHILLHRMNIRKRKKELSKDHTDPETAAAARKNMQNDSPDSTPRWRGSQLNLDTDSNPESDSESESDFSRDVEEDPSSESDNEAAPLIGGAQEDQQPKSGRFGRRGDTAYSLEDGRSAGSQSEPRARRMSTDEARTNFSMFTWMRETITADKKSIRSGAGADGVLLTGFLYRLMIMLGALTLTVTLPLGGLYASYDWTTDVTPDEVELPDNYTFRDEHWIKFRTGAEKEVELRLTHSDEIKELVKNLEVLEQHPDEKLASALRVPKQEEDQVLEGHDEQVVEVKSNYLFKQWPKHGHAQVPHTLDAKDEFTLAHVQGRYINKVKCLDPTKINAEKIADIKRQVQEEATTWVQGFAPYYLELTDKVYSFKPPNMEKLRKFFADRHVEGIQECHVYFKGDTIKSIIIEEGDEPDRFTTYQSNDEIMKVLRDECIQRATAYEKFREDSQERRTCIIVLDQEMYRAESHHQSPPRVQMNHRIFEHQHDDRMVDVAGLEDHVGKTVLWVSLVDWEKDGETKLPPQRVPTVDAMRDLCSETTGEGVHKKSICSNATLGLSAARGILFNQCPDHRLTEEQLWECDDWFEIRAIPKLEIQDYTEEMLQALLDNTLNEDARNKQILERGIKADDPSLPLRKFPYLVDDDPTDDNETDDKDAVYLITSEKDLKVKDKFKMRVMKIDGYEVRHFDHTKDDSLGSLQHGINVAKRRKVHVVIDTPYNENVVRIKKTATEKLTGDGHSFEGWTVNWMSNKPIGAEDFVKIPLVDEDGNADIKVVTQNWSEPVYFHVEKYEKGWIDYISLVNVPFDKADVAGCPGATTRFFVIACFVWIITIGVLWLINSMMTLMKKERRRFLKKLDWPQSHSLIYKNLPLKQATQHDVELYFDTLFPDRWRSVMICREIGHGSIRRLYQRYEAANKTYKQALVDANMDVNTPPEDLYVYRPSMRRFFSKGKDKFRSGKSSSSNAIADASFSSGSNTPSVRPYPEGVSNQNVRDGNDADVDVDENEIDIVDKTEKQIETSTKLSPVEKAALRVVRIKKKLKQKWDEDEVDEDLLQPIDHPSAIVTFKTRIDKIEAADVTLEFKRTAPEVFNSNDPKDVRYWDLATHETRKQTQVVGYAFVVAVFIAFIPFVLILGYLTNPKQIEKIFPFFHDWKEEGGAGALITNVTFTYVPALILQAIVGVMVMLFLYIGNGLCSFPTGAALQRWACRVSFWFNMIFVVFGVMVVKIVFDIMTQPVAFNDVQSAARALWKRAPETAVFGITYIFIMIQGFSLRLLLNWTRWLFYVFYWIVYKSKDKALEAVSLKNEISFASFGWMTEVYVYIEVCLALTLAFCLITPIILPVAIIFLLCLLPIMKFNLMIRVPDDYTDSGGKIWMQSLRHLLWIMGFFYVFTICICVLRLSLSADGGIAVVFIVVGAMVFFYTIALWLTRRYKFEHLPLYEARKMQSENESWAASGSAMALNGSKEDMEKRFAQPEIEFMTRMPKDYKASTSGSSWCEERKNTRKHVIDTNIPEEEEEDVKSSENGNDAVDSVDSKQ